MEGARLVTETNSDSGVMVTAGFKQICACREKCVDSRGKERIGRADCIRGQNREASEQTHPATVGNTEWVGVQAKHGL